MCTAERLPIWSEPASHLGSSSLADLPEDYGCHQAQDGHCHAHVGDEIAEALEHGGDHAGT